MSEVFADGRDSPEGMWNLDISREEKGPWSEQLLIMRLTLARLGLSSVLPGL
jgi:hypothetical protein